MPQQERKRLRQSEEDDDLIGLDLEEIISKTRRLLAGYDANPRPKTFLEQKSTPNPRVTMAPKRKPTDIVSLKVRFTEQLRKRIAEEAKKNQRSLNGEIVYRLGVTFGAEGAGLVGQYEEAEEELKKWLQEMVVRVTAQKPWEKK